MLIEVVCIISAAGTRGIDISLVLRKPVLVFSDQVRHKPGCEITGECSTLEISDLETKEMIVARQRKLKALICLCLCISHTKTRFSHESACSSEQILLSPEKEPFCATD